MENHHILYILCVCVCGRSADPSSRRPWWGPCGTCSWGGPSGRSSWLLPSRRSAGWAAPISSAPSGAGTAAQGWCLQTRGHTGHGHTDTHTHTHTHTQTHTRTHGHTHTDTHTHTHRHTWTHTHTDTHTPLSFCNREGVSRELLTTHAVSRSPLLVVYVCVSVRVWVCRSLAVVIVIFIFESHYNTLHAISQPHPHLNGWLSFTIKYIFLKKPPGFGHLAGLLPPQASEADLPERIGGDLARVFVFIPGPRRAVRLDDPLLVQHPGVAALAEALPGGWGRHKNVTTHTHKRSLIHHSMSNRHRPPIVFYSYSYITHIWDHIWVWVFSLSRPTANEEQKHADCCINSISILVVSSLAPPKHHDCVQLYS